MSTGPSSISIDLTYDRKRLDEAITKITGAGLAPKEIIEVPRRCERAAGSALPRARRVLDRERHHQQPVAGAQPAQGVHLRQQRLRLQSVPGDAQEAGSGELRHPQYTDSASERRTTIPDSDPFKTQGNKFYQADLVSELSDLTRAANRANVTMYTIDPRGLVGMPDLDEKVDMVEWQDYMRTSQDSLRAIAEVTGGYAAVNQNDFDKALKRIDAETSDYYVIGYYSNNPDPRKRNRDDRDQGDAGRSERHAPQGLHVYGKRPIPTPSSK